MYVMHMHYPLGVYMMPQNVGRNRSSCGRESNSLTVRLERKDACTGCKVCLFISSGHMIA